MDIERLYELETPGQPQRLRRRLLLAIGSLMLWGLTLSLVVGHAVARPSVVSVLIAVIFVLLFAVVYAQMAIIAWMGNRSFHRLNSKIKGSGYISELGGLPNRNYLLAELRREMPRARSEGVPFSVMVLSLDTLDEVRERRGDAFADRALHQLVETLRRATRNSDFLAHLGGARFCVLLVECTGRDALLYLKRLPGSVAVSDGRHMYDVPITARLAQYDMESLYATDVLAEAEEARALQRKMPSRPEIRVA
jgi:diguanylate cyclase (GGDEF)-like protein